jgi:hypothetical protein
MSQSLDAAMLEAHLRQDLSALVGHYTEAADVAEDLDAECFYLTHAYIFALDFGDPRAKVLHQRLVEYGRDA